MKILFANAHPYIPQMYGGLQTSTDQLCQGLIARGHQVALLSSLMPNGFMGRLARLKIKLRQMLGKSNAARDTGLGYNVWRAWFPADVVAEVIAEEKPDLVVVLSREAVRIGLAARKAGAPIILSLHDVEFEHHGGDFGDLGHVACIANSHYTADKYHDAYGVRPQVIYPFISSGLYEINSTRKAVTFINPHPYKGLETALSVAKLCPHISFQFVETWPLEEKERRVLNEALARLPNVALIVPQKDMRKVYGITKILLVPSIWEEAYGRVAAEVQLSGIPVIASRRGGLPEAVGPGGILIDPGQDETVWAKAVQDLWHDEAHYNELSQAAFLHAHRIETNLNAQIDLHEQAFLSASRGL